MSICPYFWYLIVSYSMIWSDFSKDVHPQGEPRCIDSLSQWLDFWIRCPTTWALKSAGTVWPGPFLNCEQSGSEMLLLILLTAISAWSMFSTNSPWSSVSGFLRNMTCIIMIHHDTSWFIMIHQFMMRLWFQHIESASLWSEKQKTDVQISSRQALQFLLQVPVLWETAWHLPIAPAGTTSLTRQQEYCHILICHDCSISEYSGVQCKISPKTWGNVISHTKNPYMWDI